MKQIKIFIVWIIAIMITGSSGADSGIVDSDSSFHDFCAFSVKGQYTKRTDDSSPNGDICDISFQVKTRTEEDAKRFCRYAVPFPILESKFGAVTKCQAQSLVICPPTYQQIAGKCYKLVHKNEHYTYEDAVEKCERLNAKIAEIGEVSLSRHFDNFFPALSLVWVEPDEDMIQHTVISKGDQYVMLYGSALQYRVRYQSLAQIEGDKTALVICEKEAMPTGAMTIINMQKYGQIYYGSGIMGNKVIIPTHSRYYRKYDNEKENHEVCERISKPFRTKFPQAYIPKDLSTIDSVIGKSVLIARSILTRRYNPDQLRITECAQFGRTRTEIIEEDYVFSVANSTTNELAHVINPDLVEKNAKDDCDAEMSMAYLSRQGKTVGVYASDALRAPLLCLLNAAYLRLDKCAPGQEFYRRKSGEALCHFLFDGDMTWDDAQRNCKTQYNDGVLSGFAEDDELLLFDSMLRRKMAGKTEARAWLGATRSSECRWNGKRGGKGYETDGNCDRNNVYQWVKDAAPNGKASRIGSNWFSYMPDYLQYSENCLEVLTGNFSWNKKEAKKALNDARCDIPQWFFCQRPAERSYVVA